MSRAVFFRALFATAALGSAGIAAVSVWAATLDYTFVAETDDYDAGTCPAGAVVTHQFRLSNRSLDPVTITALTPACSCDTEIRTRPGEVGRLTDAPVTVAWRTPEKTGPAQTHVIVSYKRGNESHSKVLVMRCSVVERDTAGVVR